MKKQGLAMTSAILGLFMLSNSMSAHHGTNISYDHDRPTKLTGTVTEFAFSNPHAQIYFDVRDDDGNIVHWAGELNSPFRLKSAGWTKETLKPGDAINLTVFPSLYGTPVGLVDRSQPLLANGKVVSGTGEQGE